MKTCNFCEVELTDENWQASYQKRWYYLCKDCDKQRQRERAAASPKRRFYKRYGLDLQQYTSLVERSGGVCEICSSPQTNGKELCIDHCHETGRVRGLLCTKCNMALGLFNDNVGLLDKAKEYLNEDRGY